MKTHVTHFCLWTLGICLVCGGLFGCGPIESTAVIVQADTAVHNAKTVDADKKAPYEFTAAEQYLKKARQMWGSSDFEYAMDYAAKARDLAVKAREEALKN